MHRRILTAFAGFSFVGLISTSVSLGLIYVFIGFFKTPVYLSYILIYIATIYLSYYINSKFVFNVRQTFRRVSLYFLTYLSGMLVGIILIKLLKILFALDDWVITCCILPVTTAWNFIFVSFVLGNDYFIWSTK